MRPIRTAIIVCVVAASVLAQCGSASLSTLYAANNGGSTGWGVFFDVAIASPLGINICAFDTNTGNTAVGTPFTISVYVTPASYVNVHGAPSAWRLVATGAGSAAGNNLPSLATLAQPMYLPAGNYGIALYHYGASPRYTNGTGANQIYGNTDLTITTGLVRSTFFGTPTVGSIFTPRVWNGGIYYETCSPSSAAGFGFMASGCAGTMAAATIDTVSRPQLGGLFSVNVTNLPLSYADLIIGLSNTTSPFGPLPLGLAPFGLSGCSAYVSPDLIFPVGGAANTANFSVGLPPDPALQCLQFFMQAIVYDPAANTLGFVMSDAGAGVMGL